MIGGLLKMEGTAAAAVAVPWATWIVNVVLLAVSVGIIRSYVLGVKKDVQKELKTSLESFKAIHVQQVKFCNSKFAEHETECKGIWDAVNGHGHKGLDKNGSRVTRGG